MDVANGVSFLASVTKLRYTRTDMELIILRQFENLDALRRRVQLLEKQNELLIKYNHKLIEELSDKEPPVTYPHRRKEAL